MLVVYLGGITDSLPIGWLATSGVMLLLWLFSWWWLPFHIPEARKPMRTLSLVGAGVLIIPLVFVGRQTGLVLYYATRAQDCFGGWCTFTSYSDAAVPAIICMILTGACAALVLLRLRIKQN
jgi:hypothetical protein